MSSGFQLPTEVVYSDGDTTELAKMLDARFLHGWKLVRIIESRAPSKKPHPPPTSIYYFERK